MPIDIPSLCYDAVFTRIQTGVNAYNLTGARSVQPGNVLDNRGTGRIQERLGKTAPADFPLVGLKIAGGGEQKTSTPTFGLMSGAACDAIIPTTVALELWIVHDTQDDASQTPLEACIDAALKAGYPKFGISYCRFTTIQHTRKDIKIGEASRTQRVSKITFDLWPHLSVVS